ncbi:MAG: rab-GTPase-TBC domain-containing protein [Benjaminiella poitrasii]|nr:MAG: rab-GTPase-TBC domain-containing protein [Benjaminiella poitrasii]
MTDVLESKRKLWDVIFNDPNLSLNSLRHRAIAGTVCQNGLRSVCWKIFLGYLPTLEVSTWPSIQYDKRQHYQDLKRKYIEEPAEKMKKSENAQEDLLDNNPLALNDNNPWQQYFADSEIRKVIRQDVERTFPDIEFFRDEKVQQSLSDILFIYCKLNGDVSYRQGMHELLAPFYWILALESIPKEDRPYVSSDPATKLMIQVLDSDFVEHDAYILFDKLMKYGKSWYEFNDDLPKNKKTIKTDLLSMANNNIPKPTESARLNPVVMTCHRIHHQYLRTVDPLLYRHLESFSIEPQLYGLRWIRLLFGREFDIYELLKLWDAIFAQDPTLQIVGYVCLVILLHMRDLLLRKDYAECLSLLMRPPPISKPALLVEQAKHLQENLSEDTALDILQQNDIRSGKEPRTSMSDGFIDPHRRQPLNHKGSQGFSRLTNNVMKNPQMRDLNKAIAGVMGTVQKNVNTLGENILGRPQEGLGPRRSTVSSEFPSAVDRIVTTQYKQSSSPIMNKPASLPAANYPRRSSNAVAQHQMGEMMATCIRLLENELFPPSEKEMVSKDKSKKEEDNEEETTAAHVAEQNPASNTTDSRDDATIITAFAGLKHIRDVLLGKQTHLDSSVLSQFEKNNENASLGDEWDMIEHDNPSSSPTPPPKPAATVMPSPAPTDESDDKLLPPFIPYVSTTPAPPKQHVKYRIEDLLSDPDLQLPSPKSLTSSTTQKLKWMLDDDKDDSSGRREKSQGDQLFQSSKTSIMTDDEGLLLFSNKLPLSSRKKSSFTAAKKALGTQERSKSYESTVDPLDAKNVDNRKAYEYDMP